MAKFCIECDRKGIVRQVFSGDWCGSHQYLNPKKDKRSINERAVAKRKEEKKRKPTKAGWFDVQAAFKDELNSKIVYAETTPESYDGERIDVGNMDEMPMWDGVDESLANLSSDLDMVMSLYIRHKYSDSKGMVKCFTCPVVLPIKEIQNGHYIKRGNRATRFLEANLRPQCPTCNQDHNYDETPYTNALEAEQPGLAAELNELGKLTYKATREELKSLLIEYRAKLEILKKKLII